MKAVRLLEFGGKLVLDEAPVPEITSDQVLVRVKSTAVNHLDLVKASGALKQILPIGLPWTPGHEFSGVVEKIGRMSPETYQESTGRSLAMLRRQVGGHTARLCFVWLNIADVEWPALPLCVALRCRRLKD